MAHYTPMVTLAVTMMASACSDDGRQMPTDDLPPIDVPQPGTTDEGGQDSAGDTFGDEGDEGTAGGPIGCDVDNGCQNQIDLLFVVDNSGTMAEEQRNLARQYANLISKLETLSDKDGNPIGADVNIMVTTTDMGNPACAGPWVKPDYVAAAGDPIATACTDRLPRFVSHEDVDFSASCTESCTTGATPTDPFIHFDANGHNVHNGTPADALSCIGPQGVDGCGYEAPLEAMIQALRPESCWNDPEHCTQDAWQGVQHPFLRPNAALAVVMITDEADCSMKNYAAMQSNAFIEGQNATSAICWNAGVECTGFDAATGRYAECHAVDLDLDGSVVLGPDYPTDSPALQPLSRYTTFLDRLRQDGKQVVMLGILGVPEVLAHNPLPPHEPVAGGVLDLVYREWSVADLLPGDPDSVQDKSDKFGIGPGCTGFQDDAMTVSMGQAIPPVRIKEVCESLNRDDAVRCCIESICDDDFSPAIDCLTGILQDVFEPVG